jgi:aldehyde dehydrogenase (NAD+)
MSTDIAQIVSLSPQDPTHCVGSWPDMGTAGLDKAIRRARNAFAQGQGDSGHDRAKLLVRAAERVEGDAPELVSLAVVETGRPVAEARAEVQRVADTLRYYAQVALDCEGEMFPPTRASSWVLSQRRPRGVLGVISP